MFNKIGITTRREIDGIEVLEQAIDFLISKGKQVFLSDHARKHFGDKYKELKKIDYSKTLDMLIVFGGDGSVLRSVRNIKTLDTKILPISMGTLGFLAEVPPEKTLDRLNDIFNGDYKLDERQLIDVSIIRNKKIIARQNVLNDVVISYKDIARLISINAKIDEKILTKYRADGLIISTPTGSTAYNLSAGGPVMYPLIPAFILTPICPHSLTQRPIVVPNTKKINLEIDRSNDELTSATFDGQIVHTLEAGDLVKIRKGKGNLKFIRFPGEHFYKVIRKKLRWGENMV